MKRSVSVAIVFFFKLSFVHAMDTLPIVVDVSSTKLESAVDFVLQAMKEKVEEQKKYMKVKFENELAKYENQTQVEALGLAQKAIETIKGVATYRQSELSNVIILIDSAINNEEEKQLRVDLVIEYLRRVSIPFKERGHENAFLACPNFYNGLGKILQPFKSDMQNYIETRLKYDDDKMYQFDLDLFAIDEVLERYKKYDDVVRRNKYYLDLVNGHARNFKSLAQQAHLAKQDRDEIYLSTHLTFEYKTLLLDFLEYLEDRDDTDEQSACAAAPRAGKAVAPKAKRKKTKPKSVASSQAHDDVGHHAPDDQASVSVAEPKASTPPSCDVFKPEWRHRRSNTLARLVNIKLNRMARLVADLRRPRAVAVRSKVVNRVLRFDVATKNNIDAHYVRQAFDDIISEADMLAQQDLGAFTTRAKKNLVRAWHAPPVDLDDESAFFSDERAVSTARYHVDMAKIATLINKSVGGKRYDRNFKLALREFRVDVVDNPTFLHPELALAIKIKREEEQLLRNGIKSAYIGGHLKNCYACHALIHGKEGKNAASSIKGLESSKFAIHTPGYFNLVYASTTIPKESVIENKCSVPELFRRLDPDNVLNVHYFKNIHHTERHIDLSDSESD